MQRLSKKLIFTLLCAFTVQATFGANPVPDPAKKGSFLTYTIKSSFSKIVDKVTSFRPSVKSVVAGIAAAIGIGYCWHKLSEWLNPSIDPELLKVVPADSLYRKHPTNIEQLYALLFGAQGSENGIKGAAAQDKKIAVACLNDSEVREFFARQKDVSLFSRVAAINVDKLEDVTTQEKDALKEALQECVLAFHLVTTHKFEKPSNAWIKDSLNQKLYVLSHTHGKLQGLLEMHRIVQQHPINVENFPIHCAQQAYECLQEQFEIRFRALFAMPLDEQNKTKKQMPSGQWCPPILGVQLQTAVNEYAQISRKSKILDAKTITSLGLRHGHALGLLEGLIKKAQPQKPADHFLTHLVKESIRANRMNHSQ